MQMSVPELTDFASEPQHVLEAYGPDVAKQGTYAYNCLLARRLAERGVRFVQLFHQGWDQHNNLPKQMQEPVRARPISQRRRCSRDLKQRGMLDDTLVVWGGEFGRTIYSQGKLTETNYGRDHHPGCFTMWLAGGGIRGGMNYGQSDDYSVNVAENGVHVHDLHATHAAPAGHRSRAADVPLPRPRFPPDRRARPRRAKYSCLNAISNRLIMPWRAGEHFRSRLGFAACCW